MMSVIIRLQGLAWSASAMDIRNFFKGLGIPAGGVHIIGGEKGDAFIAFSTDEDARRAMMLNGGLMNDSAVQLFLSSKTEMQNTILKAKERTDAPAPAPLPAAPAPAAAPQVPGYMAGGTAAPQTLPGFNSAQQPVLPTSQLNPFQSGVSAMNAILTSAGLAGMTQALAGAVVPPKKPSVNTYEHALPGEYSVGGIPGQNQNQYTGGQLKQPQYPIDGQTSYAGINQTNVTNSAYQANQPYRGITVPSTKTSSAPGIPSDSFANQNPNIAPNHYGQVNTSASAGAYSQNEPASIWSSGYSQRPQSQHPQKPPPSETSQYQQPYQGANVPERPTKMPYDAAQSTAFPRSDDRFFSGNRPPLQPTPPSDIQYSGSKPYGQPSGHPDSSFSKPSSFPPAGAESDIKYSGSKPYGQPSGPPENSFNKPPLFPPAGAERDNQYSGSKPYGQPSGPPENSFNKPPPFPPAGAERDNQYSGSKPYGQPSGPPDNSFNKPPLFPPAGAERDNQYSGSKPYGQPSGPPDNSFNKPPPFPPAGAESDNRYSGSKPYGQPSGPLDSSFNKPPLFPPAGAERDSQYSGRKPYGQPSGPPDSGFNKPLPFPPAGAESDNQYSGRKPYGQPSGPPDSGFNKPPPFPPAGAESDNRYNGSKPYGQPSGPPDSNFNKPPPFSSAGVASDNQYSGLSDGNYSKPPQFPLARESTFSGQKFDQSMPADKRFDANQPGGQPRHGGDSGFIGQRFDKPPYMDNQFDAKRPDVQIKPDGGSSFTGQRFEPSPPVDTRYEGNWHGNQNKPFGAPERFPSSGYGRAGDREQFGQGKVNNPNFDDKGEERYEPFPEYPNPYQSHDDVPGYSMNRMPGKVSDKFQPPEKNSWSEPQEYPNSSKSMSGTPYGSDYQQHPNYQTDFIEPEPMDIDPNVETDIAEQSTPGLMDEKSNIQSEQPKVKDPAKAASEVKHSSSGNDKGGRSSKERSRDTDRSRRDSPSRRDRFGREIRDTRRDRDEHRDRDRRDRNKDEDRRSRRDRERDRDRDRGRDRHRNDRRSKDRDDDKRDRGRGSDKKSSSNDDSRRSRKRSLSPNSQKNNTDEKKLQVEKGEAKVQQGGAATQPPKIIDIRDLDIAPPKGFGGTSDAAGKSLPDTNHPKTPVNPPSTTIQPPLPASAPISKGLLGDAPPGHLPFNAHPGAEGQRRFQQNADGNSDPKRERREGRVSRFSDRRDGSPHAGNKDQSDQGPSGEDEMWPGYYEPPYEEGPNQREQFDNRGHPGFGGPNNPNRSNYRGPPQGDTSNSGPEGMRSNRDDFKGGPGGIHHPPHQYEEHYHEGPPDEQYDKGYPGGRESENYNAPDYHGPPNIRPGLMGHAPMDGRRNFRGPPPGPGFDGPRGRFPRPIRPDMHGHPGGHWRDDRRHPPNNADFRGPAPHDFDHPDFQGPPRGDRRGPFDRPYGSGPQQEQHWQGRESHDVRESSRENQRDRSNNENPEFRGRQGPPFEMRGPPDRNFDRPPRDGPLDRNFERLHRDSPERHGRIDPRDPSHNVKGPHTNQPGNGGLNRNEGSTGKPNDPKNDNSNSNIQQNSANTKPTATEHGKGIALCSVVIEKMASETSYKDIRKMFTGLDIPKDGIKVINDSQGKRIGKAFVRFGNQDSFKKGLQFDRTKLNNRLIIIKPVSRKEYDTAVDSYVPGEPDDKSDKSTDRSKDIDLCNTLTATLRQLKGEPEIKLGEKTSAQTEKTFITKITRLPSTTTVDELKDFFRSCEIPKRKDAVVIEYESPRKCTGLAFVEFTNDKHFQAAFKLRRVFDKNVISLVEGTKKEVRELIHKMKSVLGRDLYAVESAPKPEVKKTAANNDTSSQKHSAPQQKPNTTKSASQKSTSQSNSDTNSSATTNSSQKSPRPDTTFIRIANAPFDLKPPDLVFLFDGLPIASRGIQICHDAIGRPIGECYVEFIDEASVEKAVKKNGTHLGRFKLSICPISKEKMIENCRILRQSLQPEAPSREAVFYFVKASNLPKGVTTGEIMNFFSGYSPAPESIRLNIGDPSHEPPDTSTALIGFPEKDEAERSLKTINGNHLRDKVVVLTKVII